MAEFGDEQIQHAFLDEIKRRNGPLGIGSGFRVGEPCSLTKNTRKGYSKEPFIGGECLFLESAYIGKRDGVILVLRKSIGSEARYEIPLSRAYYLEEFNSFSSAAIENYKNKMDDAAVEHIRDEVRKKEDIESYYKSNPNYGAW